MNAIQWVLLLVILGISFLSWVLYVRARLNKQIRGLTENNRAALETINNLRNLVQQRTERNEAERQYFDAVTIEKEQRRIANELHDDTVQRMVAVRFRLEQILYYQVHKGVETEVEALRKELDSIVADLRFLLKGLTQPRFEHHPLSYLVKELADKLSAMHHQKISLEIINKDKETNLTPEVKQELFYLIHETAHNFMKNSMGFELYISMIWTDYITIDIKDNGQGLQRGRGFGFGMVSMQERASRINAELSFISLYNGLHVQIIMPLQKSIAKGESH